MDLDSLIPIFGILLVMIPVTGVTLVLTLRLAIKPFMESLADTLRDSRSLPDEDRINGQLEELRRQVDSLSRAVRELGGDTTVAHSLPVGRSLGTGTEA